MNYKKSKKHIKLHPKTSPLPPESSESLEPSKTYTKKQRKHKKERKIESKRMKVYRINSPSSSEFSESLRSRKIVSTKHKKEKKGNLKGIKSKHSPSPSKRSESPKSSKTVKQQKPIKHKKHKKERDEDIKRTEKEIDPKSFPSPSKSLESLETNKVVPTKHKQHKQERDEDIKRTEKEIDPSPSKSFKSLEANKAVSITQQKQGYETKTDSKRREKDLLSKSFPSPTKSSESLEDNKTIENKIQKSRMNRQLESNRTEKRFISRGKGGDTPVSMVSVVSLVEVEQYPKSKSARSPDDIITPESSPEEVQTAQEPWSDRRFSDPIAPRNSIIVVPSLSDERLLQKRDNTNQIPVKIEEKKEEFTQISEQPKQINDQNDQIQEKLSHKSVKSFGSKRVPSGTSLVSIRKKKPAISKTMTIVFRDPRTRLETVVIIDDDDNDSDNLKHVKSFPQSHVHFENNSVGKPPETKEFKSCACGDNTPIQQKDGQIFYAQYDDCVQTFSSPVKLARQSTNSIQIYDSNYSPYKRYKIVDNRSELKNTRLLQATKELKKNYFIIPHLPCVEVRNKEDKSDRILIDMNKPKENIRYVRGYNVSEKQEGNKRKFKHFYLKTDKKDKKTSDIYNVQKSESHNITQNSASPEINYYKLVLSDVNKEDLSMSSKKSSFWKKMFFKLARRNKNLSH